MASNLIQRCVAPGVLALTLGTAGLAALGSSPQLEAERLPTGRLKLHWQSTNRFNLEIAESIGSQTLWKAFSLQPNILESNYSVELDPLAEPRFFRLSQQVPATLLSSPAEGESGVSANRETILYFSRPLRAGTTLQASQFVATTRGRKILSRPELSGDRKKATLFYLEPLPSNSRIQVRFDPSGLKDDFGLEIDADSDGTPGGIRFLTFDTANNNALEGTGVIGRVLASERVPDPIHPGKWLDHAIQGAIVTVDGAEESLRATTDSEGRFFLYPAPSGRIFVHIDGRPSIESAWPTGDYYPFVGKAWEVEAGLTNNLAGNTGEIFLPRITSGTLQSVSPVEATTVSMPADLVAANPELQGVSITVPAGALFDDNGNRGGRVGLAPVPADRLPGPLPPGMNLPMVITVQTDGALNFDQPAPVCFPNVPDEFGNRLAPGTHTALMSFDHDKGEWERVGSMTVNEDGTLVCSDPGSGVLKPGWHGRQYPDPNQDPGPPPPPPSDPPPPPPSPPPPPLPPPPPPPPCHNPTDSEVAACQDECNVDYLECIITANRIRVPLLRENRLKICDFNFVSCMMSCKKPICPPPAAAPASNRHPATQAPSALDEVLNAYSQIEALLLPFADADQIPATVLAQAEQLRLAVDALTGGDLDGFLLTEQTRLESSLVATLGPYGEIRGDQPSYPIHMAYEVVETHQILTCNGTIIETTTNVVRTMTQPYAQYQIFLRNSQNRNPPPIPCNGGRVYGQEVHSVLRRILFFDPKTLRLGQAHARRIPGLASGISGFFLKPTTGLTDSDHDGLADAVEWVLGTDPANPDSDGDGILDGAEIDGNANPLNGHQAATGLIASTTLAGTAVDIAAFNDIAAVALMDSGVAVIDIRDPRTPITTAILKTPGEARAVAVDESHVIVANGARGFTVVQLSPNTLPNILHSHILGSSALSAAASGGFGFVGTDSGLIAVVELSSGSLLQSLQLNERIDDLTLYGDSLFVATSSRLIACHWQDFKLEVWGTVSLSGFQQTEPITGRRRIAVLNDTAFITAFPGYGTIDVSNTGNMRIIARPVDFAPNSFKQLVPTGSGQGLAVVGITPGQLDPKTHNVQLWDISNLSDHTQVMTQFTTPGLARAATIYNGLGFVADSTAGMQVISYLPFDTHRLAPSIQLTTSATDNRIESGKTLRVTAAVSDDVQVRNVEFYVDGIRAGLDGNAPFEIRVQVPAFAESKSTLKIQARARDTGGNETLSPELVMQIERDHTPPTVAPWAPLAGSIAGAVREIGVVFSESMDPDSIKKEQFQIRFSGPDRLFGTDDDQLLTDGTLEFRGENRIALVRFNQPLSPGFYRGEFSAGSRDASGNAMATGIQWIFQTIEGIDTDGDGMSDEYEVAYGFNPLVPDSSGDADHDGASNLAESLMGTDPWNPHSIDPNILDGQLDRDGDGLTDAQEVRLGTNPFAADTDGDGWNDEAEIAAGSDPLNRSSKPILATAATPPVRVLIPNIQSVGDGVIGAMASPRVRVSLPAPNVVSGAQSATPRVWVSLPSPDSISGAHKATPPIRVSLPSPDSISGAHVATPPIRVSVLEPAFTLIGGTTVARQKAHLFFPIQDAEHGTGAFLSTPTVLVNSTPEPEPAPLRGSIPAASLDFNSFPFPILDTPIP